MSKQFTYLTTQEAGFFREAVTGRRVWYLSAVATYICTYYGTYMQD